MQLATSATARLVGPDQAACYAQLELEHDNLRAALAWCRDAGRAEVGASIAAGLWRFWTVRGHLTEGQHWLEYAWGGEAGVPRQFTRASAAASQSSGVSTRPLRARHRIAGRERVRV